MIDAPPIMPISKKSKPFRGFKNQNMDERIHIMPPEERNLQISGTEEEEIDKTQVTTQVNDDSNKTLKSLMKTSLGVKSNINLYGVKNHISKMGSFGSEAYLYICISEESISCALFSDKQNEKHDESYSMSKKHVKQFMILKK